MEDGKLKHEIAEIWCSIIGSFDGTFDRRISETLKLIRDKLTPGDCSNCGAPEECPTWGSAHCVDYLDARARQAEAQVLALTPGPFDITVTVPETVNGHCNHECDFYYHHQEMGDDCGAGISVLSGDDIEPGPGCPHYHAPKEG